MERLVDAKTGQYGYGKCMAKEAALLKKLTDLENNPELLKSVDALRMMYQARN